MNKTDLVKEVAKVVSTKKEAQAAVDCVLSTITKALKKKDTVTLVGFGTFKVAQRNVRWMCLLGVIFDHMLRV